MVIFISGVRVALTAAILFAFPAVAVLSWRKSGRARLTQLFGSETSPMGSPSGPAAVDDEIVAGDIAAGFGSE